MPEPISAQRERDGRSFFIDGYFSDRVLRGDTPVYGYPKNHVPTCDNKSMTVTTGFILALKASKR